MTDAVAWLVNHIAGGRNLPQPRYENHHGIETAVTALDSYIAPDLIKRETTPGRPAVILVSASAAVGKSSLARRLAFDSGNPLWNLSPNSQLKDFPPPRVASDFFTGALARAYGGNGFGLMEQALADGRLTLILDGADEALVRAGLASYESALADLATLLVEAKATQPERAAVVLLGRPETCEFTGAILSKLDMTWSLYELSFFDEPRSRQLVHRYCELYDRHGAVSKAHVDDLVTAVFDSVTAALSPSQGWDDDELRSFLGYAPVLQTLGRTAATGNIFGLLQSLKEGGDRIKVWNFLLDICNLICERERDLFIGTFSAGDPSKDELGRITYDLPRQFEMLLGPPIDDVRIELPESLIKELPGKVVEELTTAVRARMREHPFLLRAGSQADRENPLTRFANVVFREFLGSWALSNDDLNLRSLVSGYYGAEAVSASPLLVRLLLARSPSAPEVSSDGIGALIDSAGTLFNDRRLTVDLVQVESNDDVGVDPTQDADLIVEERPNADVRVVATQAKLVFNEGGLPIGSAGTVIQHGDVLRLLRTCHDAFVDLPAVNLSLGAGGRDFSLAGNVSILARAIHSPVEEIRISPGSRVGFESVQFTSSTERIDLGLHSVISVRAPGLRYPWRQYSSGSFVTKNESDHVLAVTMDLRRVLSWFLNPSMAGPLSYPSSAMDKIRRRSRIPEPMFTYLLSAGNIRRAGTDYHFIPPAPVGSIRNGVISDPALVSFASDYSKWTP